MLLMFVFWSRESILLVDANLTSGLTPIKRKHLATTKNSTQICQYFIFYVILTQFLHKFM